MKKKLYKSAVYGICEILFSLSKSALVFQIVHFGFRVRNTTFHENTKTRVLNSLVPVPIPNKQ